MIKNREEQPAPRLGNIARQYGLAAVQPLRKPKVTLAALEAAEEKLAEKAVAKRAVKAKAKGKRRMAR